VSARDEIVLNLRNEFPNNVNFQPTPSRGKRATSKKMASSVDAKLLKSTKFPVEFNQKVDMQKVNVEVMKKCV
jgi:hypothetical protein